LASLSARRLRLPSRPTLLPYTTLFRSERDHLRDDVPFDDHVVRPGWRTAVTGDDHDVADDQAVVRPAGQPVEAVLRTEGSGRRRSEEHTSELQSRENLVCRLLLGQKRR